MYYERNFDDIGAFEEQLIDDDFDFGYVEGYGEEIVDEMHGLASKGKRKRKTKPQFSAECEKCKRQYKTQMGYNNHMQMHNMEGAYAGVPDYKSFMQACKDIASEVLDNIIVDLPEAGTGPALKQFILDMKVCCSMPEWVSFVEEVAKTLIKCFPTGKTSPGRGTVYPMPSEIRATFTNGAAKLLTSSMRMDLCEKLKEIIYGADGRVLSLFLSAFTRRYAEDTLAFILRGMKESLKATLKVDVPIPEKSEEEMLRFKRAIHFVGGSVVKRVLNRALPLSLTHEKWEAVVSVMKDYFLVGDIVESRDKLMAWTVAQDRGGLKIINLTALSYFTVLGKMAENLDRKHGHPPMKLFMDEAHSTEMLLAWDEVVKEAIPKPDSRYLMDMCAKFFYDTWMRGSLKRIMNCTYDRGTTNVGLRSLVATTRK